MGESKLVCLNSKFLMMYFEWIVLISFSNFKVCGLLWFSFVVLIVCFLVLIIVFCLLKIFICVMLR